MWGEITFSADSMLSSFLRSVTVAVGGRFRRRRFALFKASIASLPRPLRILDVGGERGFWEMVGFTGQPDVEIVLLNVKRLDVKGQGFKFVAGDAREMTAFRDGEFDVVFSNSVIEHLGDYDQQRRMADEVRRVGTRYFLQTPNRHFPIEPHFLLPFFQYFPMRLRVFLVTRFSLGWCDREPDRQRAERIVRGIRLLTGRELQSLFPSGRVSAEKFLGLTKSFVVLEGWDEPQGHQGCACRR